MTNLEPKVLIVDDDVDILEFVTLNLSNEGFKVYTASNGLEAIQRATDIAPDLIILDVMMPEMDVLKHALDFEKFQALMIPLSFFYQRDMRITPRLQG